MTALRKILIEEEPVVTAAVTVARAPAPKLYVVPTAKAPADAPADAPKAEGSILKNILLFFAAPFLGLAYIVAIPFVGLGFLAVLAVRAAAKTNTPPAQKRSAVKTQPEIIARLDTPIEGAGRKYGFNVSGTAQEWQDQKPGRSKAAPTLH